MLCSVNLSVFANKYFIIIFLHPHVDQKVISFSTLIIWKVKHHENLYKIFMTFAIKEIIKDII